MSAKATTKSGEEKGNGEVEWDEQNKIQSMILFCHP